MFIHVLQLFILMEISDRWSGERFLSPVLGWLGEISNYSFFFFLFFFFFFIFFLFFLSEIGFCSNLI